MAQYHRIVIGVDFGTTYTAVAWADTSSPDRTELISNWPTSGQVVGVQTPSEISYEENDTSKYSWGYSISPRARKARLFLCSRSRADLVRTGAMVQTGSRNRARGSFVASEYDFGRCRPRFPISDL